LHQHLGQIAIGGGARHQGNVRSTLEDPFAFLLRHAAQYGEALPFLLELAEIVEAVEDLLLRLIADRTRVVQDEPCILFALDLAIALGDERSHNFFGVVEVHLAAKSLDIERFRVGAQSYVLPGKYSEIPGRTSHEDTRESVPTDVNSCQRSPYSASLEGAMRMRRPFWIIVIPLFLVAGLWAKAPDDWQSVEKLKWNAPIRVELWSGREYAGHFDRADGEDLRLKAQSHESAGQTATVLTFPREQVRIVMKLSEHDPDLETYR